MRIKSLSLRNIRSYKSLDIKFREGTTLLSGDIGSGKTSILLSLEFALFGLIRGSISGSTLLRHGEKEGSVTLKFDMQGEEIEIQRALKRTSSGISQEAGYIIAKGKKEDLTAIELKTRILEILGYPDELVTKSKALIFRYTVYTPQEEMKQILFESPEVRLEKLRKIFGVDKYKRVKENSSNYAKDLRSEIRAESSTEDSIKSLTEKREKITETVKEKKLSSENLEKEIHLAKKEEEKHREKIKILESEKIKLADIKKQVEIISVEKRNCEKNIADARRERDSLEKYKEEKAEVKKQELRPLEEANFELEKFRKAEEYNEEKLQTLKSQLAVIQSRIKSSEELWKDIETLENCPTCKQEVTEEHKEQVKEEEAQKTLVLKEKKELAEKTISKAESNLNIIHDKLELLAKEIDAIKESQYQLKLEKEKEKRIQENKDKILFLNKKIEEEQQKIHEKKKEEEKLLEKQKEILVDEKTILEVENSYAEAQKKTRRLEIQNAEIKQSMKDLEQSMKDIEEQILVEKKKQEAIRKKKRLETWISNHFINVVDIIERNVLSKIHSEFKAYFEEWFGMLIEDESLSTSIDETFTPVITQNGYETELENLSGGEKTSVALAYRLALNKVINDFMSTINTKDILILDEPTDGFSSHQLDRVREVLEQLNSKQTIIVSHEPKMESFVQHIIRIRKHEHESEIIY